VARREALQKAVRQALERSVTRADRPENIRQPGAPLVQRRLAEHDLIDEITSAAQRIAAARDWNGEPVYRARLSASPTARKDASIQAAD
jgi:hypothetical protein